MQKLLLFGLAGKCNSLSRQGTTFSPTKQSLSFPALARQKVFQLVRLIFLLSLFSPVPVWGKWGKAWQIALSHWRKNQLIDWYWAEAIFLFIHWFATHREARSTVSEPSLSDVALRTLFFCGIFLDARCQSLMGLCCSIRISDVDFNYSLAGKGW